MFILGGFFFNVPLHANAAIVTFLTSGTSYSTPADWNNSNNSIECIGAGGSGGGGVNLGSAGGGGGAYAKITNLTIAGSISYSIDAGGSQADTTFNSTSLVCDAGNNASGNTPGTGGLAANSTGSSKFDGGDGAVADTGLSGGGGGGAGGTTSAGNDAAPSQGGDGGTVSGGVGGLSNSGGGGAPGESGGNGTVWQTSPARGAGGGGGGGAFGESDIGCVAHGGPGGIGGNYGGGGGGGGPRGAALCSPGTGGAGAQAIIVTTYTPAVATLTRGMGIFPGSPLWIYGGGLILY